ILTIETEGGGAAPAAAEAPKEEKAAPAPAAGNAPAAAAAPPADAPKGGRYSPAVLKLSQEHGIDLNQVTGTGAGGRITRKDLTKIIESGNIPQASAAAPSAPAQTEAPKAAPAAAAPSKPAASAPNVPVVPGDVEIPVSGVRKAIAANMLRSDERR